MKAARIPSVSHDEAIVAELREDPALAAEYLQAAIADSDEPRVLLVALRQIARAPGTGFRPPGIRDCRRSSPSSVALDWPSPWSQPRWSCARIAGSG